MDNSAPTGFSAPGSAEASSMDTSSPSSMNMIESPSKRQRSTPVPVAAAAASTMRMVAEHEVPMSVRRSTSSGGTSIVSSAERNRRTALTRARRETARRHLALALADEQLAEAELEEIARPASTPGSIARLEDVASDDVVSERAARLRSNAELAVPTLLLEGLQGPHQPAPRYQDGESSPANAGSGGQGTTNILIQQTINNDGCFQGSLNVNVHQEVYHAAEQVAQVAEERHKAAVITLTATVEENHRSMMAQRMGEAGRAFDVQAKGHAEATDKLTREASDTNHAVSRLATRSRP